MNSRGPHVINLLWPEGHGGIFKGAILSQIWEISISSISSGIAPKWITPDLTDDKSTLVQVVAWGHQAIALTNGNPDFFVIIWHH